VWTSGRFVTMLDEKDNPVCVHTRNIFWGWGCYRYVKVPSSPYKRGRKGTCKRIQTFLGLVQSAEGVAVSSHSNCVLERAKNSLSLTCVRGFIWIFRVTPPTLKNIPNGNMYTNVFYTPYFAELTSVIYKPATHSHLEPGLLSPHLWLGPLTALNSFAKTIYCPGSIIGSPNSTLTSSFLDCQILWNLHPPETANNFTNKLKNLSPFSEHFVQMF
jgi:hypothetical protein